MAIGGIEMTSIVRSQDYTTIKFNEDSKGVMQQSNLITSMHQQEAQRAKQVNQGKDADWQQKKFDAREKGNGHYAGNSGQRKKKQEEEKAKNALYHSSGFDIKI